MQTNSCYKRKIACLPNRFCQSILNLDSSSKFRSRAELTAKILRTNITKLDILESDMIMRTVAAGLPDAC